MYNNNPPPKPPPPQWKEYFPFIDRHPRQPVGLRLFLLEPISVSCIFFSPFFFSFLRIIITFFSFTPPTLCKYPITLSPKSYTCSPAFDHRACRTIIHVHRIRSLRIWNGAVVYNNNNKHAYSSYCLKKKKNNYVRKRFKRVFATFHAILIFGHFINCYLYVIHCSVHITFLLYLCVIICKIKNSKPCRQNTFIYTFG